jgi:hypothetical protein
MPMLVQIALLALSAFYITILTRSLIETDKKPVACDICMSFWTSLLVLGAKITIGNGIMGLLHVLLLPASFVPLFPAAGLVYLLLKAEQHLSPPMPPFRMENSIEEKSTIVTK